MSKSKLLIIDADTVLMKAAFATQSVHRWDDDTVSTHGDLGAAKEIVEEEIEKFKDAVGDKDAGVIMCFSCPSRRYFRHDVYGPYKAPRAASTPPIGLNALRAFVLETRVCRSRDRLEADDVVGILATQKPSPLPGYESADRVVVAVDKDLLQIPGLHLHANRPREGIFRVSPEAGEEMLWTQVLTGDAVDNYPGIKGVGPAKASKILGTAPEGDVVPILGRPSLEVRAVEEYRRLGLSDEYLASQVNCARILQAKNYNFKTKEPKLWTPPLASTRS
jgi:DNA polymerase-1